MRLILFLMLIVCCSSCSDNSQNYVSSPVNVDISVVLPAGGGDGTVISSPIEVNGRNQEILISGLDSGRLYIVYAASPSEKAESRKEGGFIHLLDDGVYSLILPEGKSDVAFTAFEIGLDDGGVFRIGNVSSPEITFRDAENGMVIGQGIDAPLLTSDDGTEFFEAFFSLDVGTIPDPENVVVNTYFTYNGVSSGSKAFRFVDEHGKAIEDINGNAVVDLSAYDSVYIYAKLAVHYAETDMRLNFSLQNPVPIGERTPVELEKHRTYSIAPSEKHQMLIIEAETGGWLYESLNARFAETGKHFPRVFPVALDAGCFSINIPPHSETIMIDYGGGEGKAHLENADSAFSIAEIGEGTKTFTVDGDTCIFPVVFATGLYGKNVRLSSDASLAEGWLGLEHVSGNGYAVEMLVPGETYQANDERALEYFFFINRTGKSCTFTLSVE